MTHAQGMMHGLSSERRGSNASTSTTPSSSYMRVAGWESYHAGPQGNDERPSFASVSTTSLPGALGISSTTGDLRNNSIHSFADTSYASNAGSTVHSYDSTYVPPRPSTGDSGGPSSLVGTRSTSLGDASQARSRRPGTAGDLVGDGSIAQQNTMSMRNFLVPISGTGARQKLSILKASQRPRTAQSNPASKFNNAGTFASRTQSLQSKHATDNNGFSEAGDRGTASSSGASERRVLMQRSDSDLSAQRAASASALADASTQPLPYNSRVSSSRDSSDESTSRHGSRQASLERAPQSSRSTSRPSRSTSESGAGFSPQLTSVLSGQSSRNPLTLAVVESHPDKQAGQRQPSSFYHQKASSQSSLHSLSNLRREGLPSAAPNNPLLPRSVSHPQPPSLAPENGPRSTSAMLEKSARQTPFANEDHQAIFASRPSSATTAAREKSSTFKGLQKFFNRGSKSSQRPSTSHSISTASISPPQLQHGGNATISPLALSQSHSTTSLVSKQSLDMSGRQTRGTGEWDVGSNASNAQFRSASSLSSRSGTDPASLLLSRQMSGEQSYSGHERQKPSISSIPSWSTSSARSMRSQESFSDTLNDGTDSTVGSVRTIGPRTSKDSSPNGVSLGGPRSSKETRRGLGDALRNSDAERAEDDYDERSKTPIPQSKTPNARVVPIRKTSSESDWSQRTTTASSNNPTNSTARRNFDSAIDTSAAGSGEQIDRSTSASSLHSSVGSSTSASSLSSAAGRQIDSPRGQNYTPPNSGTYESTYSAPNSSRSLSPADPSKPSVPLTSPLLASVIAQHAQSLSTPSQTQSSEKTNKLQQLQQPVDALAASPAPSGSSDAQALPTTSPAAAETTGKPALPAKSRRRATTIEALERRSVSESADNTSAEKTNDGSPNGTPGAAASLSSESKDIQRNPQTYVPADALKRTRKGVPVRTSARETKPIVQVSPPVTSTLSNASATNFGDSMRINREGSDGQVISFGSADYDDLGTDSIDTVNLLPNSAWIEVDAALQRFKAIPAQSTNDKGTLLRTVLLPFLALEAETPETQVSGSGAFQAGKARRELFFEWIRQLLFELQTIQTSADRGAILESIACIVESRNLSASVIGKDESDEQSFFAALGHILKYAIGELNKKGVYQNTLIFSGRLLAVAFFRIAGVASKLLRALPVNRFALERVANEACWNGLEPSEWEASKHQFSPWLRNFCFEDARSYLKMLDSQSGRSEDDDRFLVRQEDIEVEMSGNWLRRWQSDDSELFFSFCRNYHRQLAGIFLSKRFSPSTAASNHFFGGPGYAHLATCIHQKCLSLVHRDILSVTTLSSQKNFNPGETANVLSGSTAGKPRHLEAANRRCTAIVVDIVRTVPVTSSQNSIFSAMLGIHIKCLVKRTSLYDVQGVFCLLDWLDGVLVHMESTEMAVEEFVDVDFLLDTVWLLLKDADHALALMRTIAFCYSNFAILTGSRRHRERFFEEILLFPAIFQKLFLSWSFTIRAYFLHLLVFRLARINDFANPEDDPSGKTSLRVIKLFSRRLDEIRKRHDELSPQPSSTDSQSDDDETIHKRRPQSFVSTIRHTPSVHKMELSPAVTKAERVLGIGMPDPVLSSKGESKAQSRAAKWFRALGGKGSGKGKSSSGGAAASESGALPSFDASAGRNANGQRFTDDVPKIQNEPRARLPRLDEMDMFSDDDDEPLNGDAGRGSEDEDLTPRSEGEFDFNHEGRLDQRSPLNSDATYSGPPLAQETKSNDDTDVPSATGEHISPDMSFDLQNTLSNFTPEAGSTQQQRISRAFSRRRSLLPGPAFSLVHGEEESEDDDGSALAEGDNEKDEDAMTAYSPNGGGTVTKAIVDAAEVDKDASPPYERSLHIYAVQSLREYEQTIQEHDEFFNSQQDNVIPQVPRLPIQWPAMWSE